MNTKPIVMKDLKVSIMKASNCYLCIGTGMLRSDEDCFCIDNTCSCKGCKVEYIQEELDFEQ